MCSGCAGKEIESLSGGAGGKPPAGFDFALGFGFDFGFDFGFGFDFPS